MTANRVETPESIPLSLRADWDALYKEVIWLHSRWAIYRQLFGTSPVRIEILNESASTFFYILQGIMLGDVQLTLSKLSERNGRTLTLESLLKGIKQLKETLLIKHLDGLIVDYRKKCELIIDRRNRQIAHYNRIALLNEESAPIPGPSREEIENALCALRTFMNCIEIRFNKSETDYTVLPPGWDGESLIAVLERGLRYGELRRTGAIGWDDMEKARNSRASKPPTVSDENSG